MKIKTSELQGAALDWAVAKCEGVAVEYVDDEITQCLLQKPSGRYAPSTDWAQGGPIIEREWVEVVPWPNESDENARWQATQHDLPIKVYYAGPSPLIAAMRCYVAMKLGDEVEVPEDLLEGEVR
jgi:hypothetical protein